MKIYPKKFENIFQPPVKDSEEKKFYRDKHRDENGNIVFGKRFFGREVSRLSFDSLSSEDGLSKMRCLLRTWTQKEWDHLVKSAWIVAKLRINDQPVKEFVRAPFDQSDPPLSGRENTVFPLNSALRAVEGELGRDFFPFKNFNKFEVAVSSYIFDFFPRDVFLAHDPFADPDFFAFPYEHVDLEFLSFVYHMEERFEILELAEKEKWTLAFFRDWTVNYAYSFNLDYGDNVFLLVMDEVNHRTPFIKDKRIPSLLACAPVIKEKMKNYRELKAFEKKEFGDMVKFKTFAECRAMNKKI